MAKKDPRLVTRADHDAIQVKVKIQGTEDYAVTVQKGKGFWAKTVHVFARRPTLPEINNYEQTASRVKFKGQNAQLEGSQITAAVNLYNVLIARTYDVIVGMKQVDQLDREESKAKVDPLIKREAIRELIAEVYSATRMAESLGADAEGSDDEEDGSDTTGEPDPEDHTSGTPPDSEQ